ncbi:GntR family transcriptional regulator [Brevibacterium sp. S111]|uniref:GntR family transcriptional regulator n=1 Tax=unclassified Brevibacterium TaxID=2614124 RepID=UPI0010822EFC|nr:GntR family transcriptional regulator [Brevibacterium sp. S111]TGD13527.1 GntR family transcriptional regulator [Brevibacterium sp. S111]
MIDDGRPLFAQIAERVEDSIIDGTLSEMSRAPSTNELASFYSINPATAAKGINLLVAKGVLEKRRGIGMFVTEGARGLLINEHRTTFSDTYITPLLNEADRLGLGSEDVIALITERSRELRLTSAIDPVTTKG